MILSYQQFALWFCVTFPLIADFEQVKKMTVFAIQDVVEKLEKSRLVIAEI